MAEYGFRRPFIQAGRLKNTLPSNQNSERIFRAACPGTAAKPCPTFPVKTMPPEHFRRHNPLQIQRLHTRVSNISRSACFQSVSASSAVIAIFNKRQASCSHSAFFGANEAFCRCLADFFRRRFDTPFPFGSGFAQNLLEFACTAHGFRGRLQSRRRFVRIVGLDRGWQ